MNDKNKAPATRVAVSETDLVRSAQTSGEESAAAGHAAAINERKALDTTPPAVDANGRPLTRTVEVAEGPNTGAHIEQAKQAHAVPKAGETDERFITHEDGSKSVHFLEAPQRREED